MACCKVNVTFTFLYLKRRNPLYLKRNFRHVSLLQIMKEVDYSKQVKFEDSYCRIKEHETVYNAKK